MSSDAALQSLSPAIQASALLEGAGSSRQDAKSQRGRSRQRLPVFCASGRWSSAVNGNHQSSQGLSPAIQATVPLEGVGSSRQDEKLPRQQILAPWRLCERTGAARL